MTRLKELERAPVLHLPAGLSRSLFGARRLPLAERLVLSALFHLDEAQEMGSYQAELPRITQMPWKRCHDSLQQLAGLGLIDYARNGPRLRLKPLTYHPQYAKTD